MKLQHDMHHASYVEKLNAELEKYPELQERTAAWLLINDVWEHAYYLKHENRRSGCRDDGVINPPVASS